MTKFQTTDPNLTKSGLIDRALRTQPCAHCGEQFGTRQVRRASSGEFVHSTCLDDYEAALKAERRAAAAAAEEAERAEAEAARQAVIAERGTDVHAWVKRCWDEHNELSESDRKLGWLIERQLSSLKALPDVTEEFAKDMASDPSRALAWSHKVFTASAKADVANIIINWWKNGGTYEQIVERMQEQLSQVAYSLSSSSTSPTSNLVETETAAAWANAVRGW